MIDHIASVAAFSTYFGAAFFVLGLLACLYRRTFKFGVAIMLLANIPLVLGLAFPQTLVSLLSLTGFDMGLLPPATLCHVIGIGAAVGTFVLLIILYALLMRLFRRKPAATDARDASYSVDAANPAASLGAVVPNNARNNARYGAKRHGARYQQDPKISTSGGVSNIDISVDDKEPLLSAASTAATVAAARAAAVAAADDRPIFPDDEDLYQTYSGANRKGKGSKAASRSRARSLHLNSYDNPINLRAARAHARREDLTRETGANLNWQEIAQAGKNEAAFDLVGGANAQREPTLSSDLFTGQRSQGAAAKGASLLRDAAVNGSNNGPYGLDAENARGESLTLNERVAKRNQAVHGIHDLASEPEPDLDSLEIAGNKVSDLLNALDGDSSKIKSLNDKKPVTLPPVAENENSSFAALFNSAQQEQQGLSGSKAQPQTQPKSQTTSSAAKSKGATTSNAQAARAASGASGASGAAPASGSAAKSGGQSLAERMRARQQAMRRQGAQAMAAKYAAMAAADAADTDEDENTAAAEAGSKTTQKQSRQQPSHGVAAKDVVDTDDVAATAAQDVATDELESADVAGADDTDVAADNVTATAAEQSAAEQEAAEQAQLVAEKEARDAIWEQVKWFVPITARVKEPFDALEVDNGYGRDLISYSFVLETEPPLQGRPLFSVEGFMDNSSYVDQTHFTATFHEGNLQSLLTGKPQSGAAVSQEIKPAAAAAREAAARQSVQMSAQQLQMVQDPVQMAATQGMSPESMVRNAGTATSGATAPYPQNTPQGWAPNISAQGAMAHPQAAAAATVNAAATAASRSSLQTPLSAKLQAQHRAPLPLPAHLAVAQEEQAAAAAAAAQAQAAGAVQGAAANSYALGSNQTDAAQDEARALAAILQGGGESVGVPPATQGSASNALTDSMLPNAQSLARLEQNGFIGSGMSVAEALAQLGSDVIATANAIEAKSKQRLQQEQAQRAPTAAAGAQNAKQNAPHKVHLVPSAAAALAKKAISKGDKTEQSATAAATNTAAASATPAAEAEAAKPRMGMFTAPGSMVSAAAAKALDEQQNKSKKAPRQQAVPTVSSVGTTSLLGTGSSADQGYVPLATFQTTSYDTDLARTNSYLYQSAPLSINIPVAELNASANNVLGGGLVLTPATPMPVDSPETTTAQNHVHSQSQPQGSAPEVPAAANLPKTIGVGQTWNHSVVLQLQPVVASVGTGLNLTPAVVPGEATPANANAARAPQTATTAAPQTAGTTRPAIAASLSVEPVTVPAPAKAPASTSAPAPAPAATTATTPVSPTNPAAAAKAAPAQPATVQAQTATPQTTVVSQGNHGIGVLHVVNPQPQQLTITPATAVQTLPPVSAQVPPTALTITPAITGSGTAPAPVPAAIAASAAANAAPVAQTQASADAAAVANTAKTAVVADTKTVTQQNPALPAANQAGQRTIAVPQANPHGKQQDVVTVQVATDGVDMDAVPETPVQRQAPVAPTKSAAAATAPTNKVATKTAPAPTTTTTTTTPTAATASGTKQGAAGTKANTPATAAKQGTKRTNATRQPEAPVLRSVTRTPVTSASEVIDNKAKILSSLKNRRRMLKESEQAQAVERAQQAAQPRAKRATQDQSQSVAATTTTTKKPKVAAQSAAVQAPAAQVAPKDKVAVKVAQVPAPATPEKRTEQPALKVTVPEPAVQSQPKAAPAGAETDTARVTKRSKAADTVAHLTKSDAADTVSAATTERDVPTPQAAPEVATAAPKEKAAPVQPSVPTASVVAKAEAATAQRVAQSVATNNTTTAKQSATATAPEEQAVAPTTAKAATTQRSPLKAKPETTHHKSLRTTVSERKARAEQERHEREAQRQQLEAQERAEAAALATAQAETQAAVAKMEELAAKAQQRLRAKSQTIQQQQQGTAPAPQTVQMPSLHPTEPELTAAAASDAVVASSSSSSEQTVAPATPKRSLKTNIKSRVRLAHEQEAQGSVVETAPTAAPAAATAAPMPPAQPAQPTQPPTLLSRKLPQSLKKRMRVNKA